MNDRKTITKTQLLQSSYFINSEEHVIAEQR